MRIVVFVLFSLRVHEKFVGLLYLLRVVCILVIFFFMVFKKEKKRVIYRKINMVIKVVTFRDVDICFN